MKPNRAVLTLLLVASSLLLTFSPHPSSASATESWRTPLDSPLLVREFRQPNADWAAGHRGVDYLTKIDQPVYASHDGVVSFVGKVVNRSLISIRHENGLITTLEPVCSKLSINDHVSTSDLLGTVCNSPDYESHCGTRLCLHFSLRTAGGYLSPLVVIGGLAPSRLKPWGGLRCSPPSDVQC